MDWVISWLKERQEQGLLRQLRPVNRLGRGKLLPTGSADTKKPFLDFSSNDYLALSEHPAVIQASEQALKTYGAGVGAARLMSGDLNLFHELEQAVAALKGKDAALLFGSGYMANVGVIPALAGKGDIIFADRLNHASIYDGCRLSGAVLKRFHHNDLNHLETLLQKHRGKGRALIVVESIYSMDGDMCPLEDLVILKERFDCLLMVDEAHATGLYGKNGGGLIEEFDLADKIDIAMGTFGKALGSYGAYIASTKAMVSYLINRARSFIFSTGLPPAVAGASLAAVKLLQQEPQLRKELHQKTALFKSTLKQGGLHDNLGPSQIVPVLIGNSHKALDTANQLYENHIFATAVRPPTVPENTARIRFSITRHLADEEIKSAAELVLQILGRSS